MDYFRKLIGEKVYLSPINQKDLELYTKWINDLETALCLDQAQHVYSLDKEQKVLSRIVKSDHSFAIVEKERDTLLGNCSLMEVEPFHRRALAGIFIGEPSSRDKGYGSDALKILLAYGFRILNLHSIALNVYSFNKRAIASYKRIGFQERGSRREAYLLDGTYHDILLMDILAPEFHKSSGGKLLDEVVKISRER